MADNTEPTEADINPEPETDPESAASAEAPTESAAEAETVADTETETAAEPIGAEPAKAWKLKQYIPHQKLILIGVAALIVGVVIGGAGGPGMAAEYEETIAGLQSDIKTAKKETKTAEGKTKNIEGKLAALELSVGDLRDREADVLAREEAVKVVEDTIAAGTIPGNGIFIVGVDVQPGTYKSSGGSSCYWARLNATGDDIIDNNIGSGPTVLTVQPSDGMIETSGCDDFRKV
jgi:hypothetical protein